MESLEVRCIHTKVWVQAEVHVSTSYSVAPYNIKDNCNQDGCSFSAYNCDYNVDCVFIVQMTS